MKMLNLLLLLCASVCFCAENLEDNPSAYTVENSMCAFTFSSNYAITSMIEKKPASYQFRRLLVGPMFKQVEREIAKGANLLSQAGLLINDMRDFAKKHSKDLSPADSNERTTLLDLYQEKKIKAFLVFVDFSPGKTLHSILTESKEVCLQLTYDLEYLQSVFEKWKHT